MSPSAFWIHANDQRLYDSLHAAPMVELLHIGVHYERRRQQAGQPDQFHDDIVDRALLHATIFDALGPFGAVYNMLDCSRCRSSQEKPYKQLLQSCKARNIL